MTESTIIEARYNYLEVMRFILHGEV